MKKILPIVLLSFMIIVSAAFAQINVVANGGFENWTGGAPDSWDQTTSGYTISQNTETVFAGASSAEVVLTSTATEKLRQGSIPIIGGQHYVIQMKVYDNDPAGRLRFWGYWEGTDVSGGPQPTYYTTDQDGWQDFIVEADAPIGTDSLSLEIRFYDESTGWDGDAVFYIDEVKVLQPSVSAPVISNITSQVFAAGAAIEVSADITDDQGIASAYLHYRLNMSAGEDSVQMSNTGGDTYTGTIPAQTNGTALDYWVSTKDVDATPTYVVSGETKILVGKTPLSMMHELDANGDCVYTGYLTRVRGIVTAATGTFSTSGHDDYIQDATGAVAVYNSTVITAMALGDSVEISGEIDQYNGKSEIVNPQITILSSGNTLPDPVVITTDQMSEQYEGMLIRINQCVISQWDETPAILFDALITDGYGDLVMHVDKDTDVPGNPAPAGLVDVMGIGGQYDNASPYTENYQLIPRSWADLNLSTSIEEPVTTQPLRFALSGNYPNPFNPTTEIRFTLDKSATTSLVVFNLLGQQVRQLVNQEMVRGVHSVVWDGLDNNGKQMGSGVYFYRLQSGDHIATKKMIMLK